MFEETLEISIFLLMFLVEAMIALLVAVVVLFILNRAKKILVEKLLARLSELDNDPEEIEELDEVLGEGESTEVNAVVTNPITSYEQYLEDALLYTKDYYQLCFNTDSIELDKDDSVDQQIIALRHTFLFAEKTLVQFDQTTPEFWKNIKSRLKRIIRAYETDDDDDTEAPEAPADDSEELARLTAENDNLKQRITNLEMFKKLFFDLQNKVKELTEQGEAMNEQAQAIAASTEDENLQGLLNQYQNAYQEMGAAAGNTPPPTAAASDDGVTQVMQVTNTKELGQLKEANADQHNIITKLRGELLELQNATPEEASDKAAEIEAQMQQLEKSLAESEMCVQMLESDYSEAMAQVSTLERQIVNQTAEVDQLFDSLTSAQTESSEQLKIIDNLTAENAALTEKAANADNTQEMMSKFAQESRDLMSCMATLEDENDEYATQVKKLKAKVRKLRNSKPKAAPAASAGNDAELKAKLAEKDAEIMRLQAEYSTLEGQYLDAFTKLNS